MAYITFQPHDYFNTLLYSGTGSTNAVTGVGFAPDMVWGKNRGQTYNHQINDTVRGVNKQLATNNTNAEETNSGELTAFGSDGFTLGTGGTLNGSGDNIVAWNWRANGSSSANTDGSISSTVSANTTSGFSIAQWTGTGSNATIGHGLGVTPKCFIIKKTSGTSAWSMYHESIGNTKFMTMNATSDATTSATVWNNTSPTSSVFSVGTADNGNTSGQTYIGYFFAEKKGFSKIGSYIGNGNAAGSFIYTGFKPAMVMIKQSSASGENWNIFDSKRGGVGAVRKVLYADTNGVEENKTGGMNFLANGIKMRGTDGAFNGSATYIYLAFAEEPLVSSNNIPATAGSAISG